MKFPTPLILAVLLLASACDTRRDAPAPPPPPPAPAAPSGRLTVPATVRDNLGITFATAQTRRVASTLRVPGRFELIPTARHENRAPFGGRVELLVKQYDTVKAGQVVARISSPEWHRMRLELEEDGASIAKMEAELRVAEQVASESEQRVALMQERVTRLQSAEVRRAELDYELSIAKSALPRLKAEIDAKKAALSAAVSHLPLAEAAVAAQLGITREELIQPVTTPQGTRPRWQDMTLVEVRAADAGIVESISVTDGGRVEAVGLILTTVDLSQLRFRAVALQSDLPRLRDGLTTTIVGPAAGGAAGGAARQGGQGQTVVGPLRISIDANPTMRTIDLLVTPDKLAPWCRPGVATYIEIDTAVSPDELAIPVQSIAQDGLTKVFFRRDKKDKDLIIRTEADLGISDGKWIVIQSGLAEGDEVVVDGVYELQLALSAGGQTKGGHFHADGTWHPDGTPEPGAKK